jgi:hypothetical protein
MRRRVSVSTEGQSDVPEPLVRFVDADWREEGYDPPSHFSRDEWPQLRQIHAYQRFLAARRAWEAETGVHIVRSWEQWAAKRRASARDRNEFNEPYRAKNFVDPEDLDPRWSE